MDDTSDSSAISKIFPTEGAYECSYNGLRCYKILDASLKLYDTVFDHFNIDLTGIEVEIRELSNDEFDRFRLGFDFSSPKKNVLFSPNSTSDFSQTVFSTICFDNGLKVFFQHDVFFHFTSFIALKRDIFYESNRSFSQSALLSSHDL